MYELLSIYKRGDFEQRTHPVIADDCDLQDRAYRLGLVTYWEKQYEKVKHEIQGFDPELVVDEINDVKVFRDIYQNIDELVKFAAKSSSHFGIHYIYDEPGGTIAHYESGHEILEPWCSSAQDTPLLILSDQACTPIRDAVFTNGWYSGKS